MTNDFAPGNKIGEYILDAPIGSGGFGTVWRGHDEGSGEVVAVKLLNGAFGSVENTAMRADVEVPAA